MLNETAKRVADLLAISLRLRNEWFPSEKTWRPWFRGHINAEWPLCPKIFRLQSAARPIRVIEDEIRQEFTMRAPGLSGTRIADPWESYFTMQHYGAPTRLLDWTEGALIGLYFATRDHVPPADAAVWILDPFWLNQQVVGEREVIAPAARPGILESDIKRYEPWLPPRYSETGLNQLPVAVYPTYTARRISTQRSCFTIHGADPEGLDNLFSRRDAHVARVAVPARAVTQIKAELSMAGIDETAIFPDLDGLGRFLNSLFDAEREE